MSLTNDGWYRNDSMDSRGNDESNVKGIAMTALGSLRRVLMMGALVAATGLGGTSALVAGNGHGHDDDHGHGNNGYGHNYNDNWHGGHNGHDDDDDDDEDLRGCWHGRPGNGRNDNNEAMLAPAGNSAGTYAIHKDGTVFTWGRNDFGQLGNGTESLSMWPVRVLKGEYEESSPRVRYLGQKNESRVVDLAGGAGHAVALSKDGLVFSWGSNGMGTLGIGTNWYYGGGIRSSSLPLAVVKGDNGPNSSRTYFGDRPNDPAVNVAAGGTLPTTMLRGDALALTKKGGLYGWGHNNYGELGVGTDSLMEEPRRMLKGDYEKNDPCVRFIGDKKGNRVTRFGIGEYNSLVLTSRGELYATGRNTYGQLGDGIAGPYGIWMPGQPDTRTPGELVRQMTPKRVLKGDYQKNNAQVKYLGEGSVKISQIAIAGHHCMALMEDGSLYMWGDNRWGLRGDGTSEPASLPKRVLKGEYERNNSSITYLGQGHVKIEKIAATCHQSGVVMSDGTVYVWGRGSEGQMGNGIADHSTTPVRVRKGAYSYGGSNVAFLGQASGNPVVDLTGGEDHFVAMTQEGSVYAWGANYSGQLGDGTLTNRSLPVHVLGQNGAGYLNLKRQTMLMKESVADGAVAGLELLGQNAPNPFSGSTTISYMIPEHAGVSLELYDVFGRKLATLVDGELDAGEYNEQVELGDYPAGTYYYKLSVGGRTAVRSMNLVR